MLKPNVGLTVDVSSPLICLTIVVLPALSKPLSETDQVALMLFSCCDATERSTLSDKRRMEYQHHFIRELVRTVN